MDLFLSLILLGPAKREGEWIKGKLASIIRKLDGVSWGRSIIFLPASDFIRFSWNPKIKASHINLFQLAAHPPDTKEPLTLQKIQAPRSQWHGDLEMAAAHCSFQTSRQHKLGQQDEEIKWQEVIMNLSLPLSQNASWHFCPLNRFSIQPVPSAGQTDTISGIQKGEEEWSRPLCVFLCVCVWGGVFYASKQTWELTWNSPSRGSLIWMSSTSSW